MRLDHVDIAAAKDEAEASGVQLYRVFERQSGGESQITVSRLGRERHTLAVLDISVIASCHAVDASADGYPIFVSIWSTGECSSAETVLHRCSLPSPLLLRRDPPPPLCLPSALTTVMRTLTRPATIFVIVCRASNNFSTIVYPLTPPIRSLAPDLPRVSARSRTSVQAEM